MIDVGPKLRDYQRPVWNYLHNGGRHAELIWHRRAGKDEVCLHWAARQMLLEPGTYWHMLPQANQVRKAIWEGVNYHTGKRRIYEAFPPQLFSYRETDMLIRCRSNGSTWQAFGSDNYEGAIGSGPRGIVYSEWAQANPAARGYFRPMITETNGWQIFITTPRGKNHAHDTFRAAQRNSNAFAELLTVYDTKALSAEQLKEELEEYVSTYGEAMGLAYFEQEYECSFDAAILGAIFGEELRKLEQEGRVCEVPHDDRYPVHVAMDIGRTDRTTMWFFQCIGGEVRVLEHYHSSGKDPEHYCGVIMGRDVRIDIVANDCKVMLGEPNEWAKHLGWRYGSICLPHDGKTKNFATKKSAEEQFAAVFGWNKVRITPNISRQDGISAARQMLRRGTFFDYSCEYGLDACKQYHYEWDEEKRKFRDIPEHDWTSDHADALRYMAVLVKEDRLPKEAEETRWGQDRTFNEMVALVQKRRAVD